MNNEFSIDNKDIIIRDIYPLRGPNIWTYRPVLEAWVDIGELEEFPSNKIPGFTERINAWLPTLVEHRCSYGERGGFLRRLDEGTWIGHILEHVTLELQGLAGHPGGFGRARETSEYGVYKVVVHTWLEDITRKALYTARELILSAIAGKSFDVSSAVAELVKMSDSLCLGPSTACIVSAAAERQIPAIRILSEVNLVQLGYGAAMMRIWTAETDRTSAIAESISRDKDLTKTLLASCGIPAPSGREVKSAADAWEAAQEIGLPVCVKPVDGNHGRGVFIDVKQRPEIEEAYHLASKEGSGVLVESFVPGIEHRLLVVGDKLIAANRSEVIKVIGDGILTVSQLIDRDINSDPRRGVTELHPLYVVRFNDAVLMELSRQKLSPESIPSVGQEVMIQRNANHSFDCTDEVHPDTVAMVTLAARIIGLDIAGIDLVANDISLPLAEQKGAIVEVNAGPSLLMHLKPGIGKPRPVGRAIIDSLFKEQANGRIPIIGISGTRGKTSIARIIANCIYSSGRHLGMASSDGVFLSRRQIQKGNSTNWNAGRRLLLNRTVEVAIIENGGSTILNEGLAYDCCQIGIVTNIVPELENLSRWDIITNEKYVMTYRTQVDVVLKQGCAILNADDELVAGMANLSEGEVIFFSIEGKNPVFANHLQEGKRGVCVQDGCILLVSGNEETLLCRINEIPLIANTYQLHAIANVLASVAACWALGLTMDVICIGIKTLSLKSMEEVK